MDPKYTFAGTVESNTAYILTACYVLLWVFAWPVALLITIGGAAYLRQQWRSKTGVFSDSTK
jgi:hypothetical protein